MVTMLPMSDQRISIRCSEETRRQWRKAVGKLDVTYEEFARAAAQMALDNEGEFRRQLHQQNRQRNSPD